METKTSLKPTSAITNEEKKQREKASKALSNARQRCNNPLNKDYATYGGQGIKVLLANVDELIAAIGLPPLNGTLDRIDPNGHYEASNVRWATKAVQAANKKSSLAGSTLPLHTLIAQQKYVVEQEQRRPRVTEAWHLLASARNVGGLTQSGSAHLVELLDLHASPQNTFAQHDTVVGGNTQTIFRMPSLTFPDGIVDARGPLAPASDDEMARRYTRNGLLSGFRNLDSQRNLPPVVRASISKLLKEKECPGVTLIGRPSQDDLCSGWFEVWMLAAASRIPSALGLNTAFFPALTCLQLLKELGNPHCWDEVPHPLLDARLLFVPDFQLDCGPWGHLGPLQYGMLERLLAYRIENRNQTVVGVQAPHTLSPGLRKILLAHFEPKVIPNGTKAAAYVPTNLTPSTVD